MPQKSAGRRPSPRWARWCLVLGSVLLVAAGSALAGSRLVLATATRSSISQQNLLGAVRAGAQRQHATVSGAKNILLAGLDTRRNQDPSQPSRSDSIIILHIPADHIQGYLISLPRDTYVSIPAYDNGKIRYAGGKDKMGKVFMYVDETTTSIHIGHTADGRTAKPYVTHTDGTIAYKVPGVTPNVYTKGNHCLTPTGALDFVRQRDLLANKDYDYGRQRHQQQFLKAVLRAVVHDGLTSPTRLPGLLSAVGRTMTVDDGGVSLADWAFTMRNVDPDNLVTVKTNGGHFNSRTVPGVGSVEILDSTSRDMLQAVRDDTVGAFLRAHPTWAS